jgi:sterol desaturase/sphingolipid hydroxylase (fatty acid hydroxylase superfamily)
MNTTARSPDARRPRPSLARILGVLTATVLAHIGLVQVARGGPLSVPAGVLSALLVGAVGEWLVHRFLMHRRWRPRLLRTIYDLHHRAHHFVHFTTDRYVHQGPINYVPVWPARPEVLCDSGASRWLSMGAQFLFYGTAASAAVLLPTALLAPGAAFMCAFIATFAVEIFLFVRLHDAVHYPGASFLERLPLFWKIDRHHYLHHIDTEANTNFLLPLGDWLFGTLRTRTTPWEEARFPTYAQARQKLIVDAS